MPKVLTRKEIEKKQLEARQHPSLTSNEAIPATKEQMIERGTNSKHLKSVEEIAELSKQNNELVKENENFKDSIDELTTQLTSLQEENEKLKGAK